MKPIDQDRADLIDAFNHQMWSYAPKQSKNRYAEFAIIHLDSKLDSHVKARLTRQLESQLYKLKKKIVYLRWRQ